MHVRTLILTIIVTTCWVLIPGAAPTAMQAVAAAAQPYEIVVDKSEQELQVRQGKRIVKRYRAAVGRGGKGSKRQVGDKKTPVGVYRIVKFKDDSQFHYFMQLDYPNPLDAWYGYKNEVIDGGDFRVITAAFKNNEIPPQDTGLGGYIGIHGIGEESREKLSIHQDENWTAGCIALTNEEIMELRQYVSLGTRVIIQE